MRLPFEVRVLNEQRDYHEVKEVVGEIKNRERLKIVGCAGLLLELLQIPVPGSPEFPQEYDRNRNWYDPVTALEGRSLRESSSVKPDIDRLIEQIASASGRHREHLVGRVAALFETGMLEQSQQKELVENLYHQTDEFRLPKNTSCYDTFLLAIPRPEGMSPTRERDLFRAKYIDYEEQNGNVWSELKRTSKPFGPPRSSKSRSLSWTRSDLKKLLSHSERWLEKSIDKVTQSSDRQSSLDSFFQTIHKPFHHQLRRAFLEWLEFLDNVILWHPKVSEDLIDRTVVLLDTADQAGLQTVRVVPSLVFHQRKEIKKPVMLFGQALGDRDELTVWQACSGIARWCEIDRKMEATSLPPELLYSLGTILSERRHEQLPLLISTAKDAVEIRGNQLPNEFIEQLQFVLEQLLLETDYRSDAAYFSTERKIRIRIRCVQLASSLKSIGKENYIIKEWLDIANKDTFSEVRKAL